MNVEMTIDEAKLLIATLLFAEESAAILRPEMARAIADLRKWRTALLLAYMRESAQTVTLPNDAGAEWAGYPLTWGDEG